MTVTSIIRVPEVGEVGVAAKFFPSGELVGVSRWYLTKAPISSALPTLATVGTDYASAKLTTENGQATLTPDVPGHYEVEHHDVTVVHTYKTWDEQPDTPDTDNDFAGAPVVTLNTAEALSRYKSQADYRVVETISRTIGAAPNVATVKIVLHEAIEPDRNDSYTLVPANTPIGKIAQYGVDRPRWADVQRRTLVHLDPALGAVPVVAQEDVVRAWLSFREVFASTAHHAPVDPGRFEEVVEAFEALLGDRIVPRTFEKQDQIAQLIREAEGRADD